MPLFMAVKHFKYALLCSICFALLLGCAPGNESGADDGPPPSRAWTLVWSDEFEGSALNVQNWEPQIGDGKSEGLPSGWGNNELQYYTADNVEVSNGNLVIISRADNPLVDSAFGYNPSYTFSSGRIRTQGKFDFKYGRVEARIKMPDTKGIWNAFWLLGSDPSPYGEWAAKGELDIVETWRRGDPGLGIDPFISGAAHFGGPFPYNTRFDKALEPFDFFSDYHVYAIEWDELEVRWFVDGINYFSLRRDNYWNYFDDAENGFMPGGPSAPFDQEFHIILNAAVGGNLPDSANEPPLNDVSFYGEMLVDYVRVYQCSFPSTDGEGVGCKNSIDQAEDYLAYEFPVNDGFSSLVNMYLDGPGAEKIPGGKQLALSLGNGLTLTELSEAGNTYLDIVAPSVVSGNVPRVSIVDAATENFILAGFTPDGLGDIKFDIFVEADSVNLNGNMRVSIISGSSRSSIIIPINTFPVGEWQRVTLPITDILTGGPNPIDVGAISELVRFEFADAHVRLDNVQLACGGQVCGLVDEVLVYVDGVEEVWDRGIVGNDEDQKTAGNADYTVPDMFHVQWEEIVTNPDPLNFESHVRTTFGTTGTDGAVNFIGSTKTVPTIAALTSGEFQFDIRMVSNPNNVEMLFKIDADGSTTGEQPLGTLPLNVWQRFTCPIATLSAQGLDVSKITAPFVLVPGNQGAGQGVVVEWDNVLFSPISSGSSTPLNLPLVFDSLPGFCLPIAPFAGGAFRIVSNPAPDATNGNSRVGEIRKFDPGDASQTFGGVSAALQNPVVFGAAASSVGKAITLTAYSSRVGMPITLKVEGGPPAIERVMQTTLANQWETLTFDFNGEAANNYGALSIIVDDGVIGDGGADFTVLVDDINQVDATSSVADLNPTYNFDAANTVYPLTDFGEARSKVGVGPMIVDPGNPSQMIPDPANNGNVGEVFLGNFATSFAGTIMGGAEGFVNPIPFAPGRTTIRMRVWTPSAGTTISLKVEDSVDQNQNAEVILATSVSGWETLDFDFAVIDQSQSFEKLVLIFNPGVARGGETYYWDDVELLP